MKAMLFKKVRQPLELVDLPEPSPGSTDLLIQVKACAICRTDLHIVDGELSESKVPLVLGHQIVGVIKKMGKDVQGFSEGQRVGVPWLGKSCGCCPYCQEYSENLCDQAQFTGYQIHGGFAQYCTADSRFCFPIPKGYPDAQAAPLLCAGLIGYRAWKKVGKAKKIGFYGFGSAAHILIQIAQYEKKEIYAFTRPDDSSAQTFAREVGAVWAGDSNKEAPCLLDAAIIFAPEGKLVPKALSDVRKGGRVVCAGIHMSAIPSFPYSILWGERRLESVANLTRKDGEEFLNLAPKVPIQTKIHEYSLGQVNEALNDLRHGRFEGAGVVVL